MHERSRERPIRLRARALPLQELSFEPRNEAGVVLLFGRHAQTLGFEVLDAQTEYPDCRARYGKRTLRIEFEYESRNFERHRHDPQGCDLIVCWRHVWPGMGRRYQGLPILELRKVFGVGRRVFTQALDSYYADQIPGGNRYAGLFSVPATAGVDDLILIYRPLPDGTIRDAVRVAGPVERAKAAHTGRTDWMAEYQRVARLAEPLDLDDIAAALDHDRSEIGRRLQGRRDVSTRWPQLRKKILEKNPKSRESFDSYGPSRLGTL
jgi:hypothetical protein